MNRALLYLTLTLCRRRCAAVAKSFKRPTVALGWVALVIFFAGLFLCRHEEWVGQCVKKGVVVGVCFLMLAGSIFKGYSQRGLDFEEADLQFLFTSPFTDRQLLVYRLVPKYMFAVVQALGVVVLLAAHLETPVVVFLCATLFQVACFHISSAAALYAGRQSDAAHYRGRWMLLMIYFVFTLLYLRFGWDLHLVPAGWRTSVAGLAFYPAVDLGTIVPGQAIVHWADWITAGEASALRRTLGRMGYAFGFAVAAWVSFRVLLRNRHNLFESSLEVTSKKAYRRQRLERGQRASGTSVSAGSFGLPRFAVFQGVGAILWKNLIVASRCRRELALASAFTLIFSLPLVCAAWLLHHYLSQGAQIPIREARMFNMGLALMFGALPYLLERALPFDFRREGPHIAAFRTMPFSSVRLVLAQLAVPIGLCLALQWLGASLVIVIAGVPWWTAALIIFGFPAVATGVIGVWNIHYLLAARRSTSGRAPTNTPAGMLLVVALSFLIFYPAGWVATHSADYFPQRIAIGAAAASAVLVQYLVNCGLILILRQLYENFEVIHDG